MVAGVAGLESLVGTGSGGIVHHKNIEVEDRFDQKECSVIFQERKDTKGGAKKKLRQIIIRLFGGEFFSNTLGGIKKISQFSAHTK